MCASERERAVTFLPDQPYARFGGNLEDRDPVQLDALLRVENEVAGVRLANG